VNGNAKVKQGVAGRKENIELKGNFKKSVIDPNCQ
jgi:hypothetical protein